MVKTANHKAISTYNKVLDLLLKALRKEIQSGTTYNQMGSKLGVSGVTVGRWLTQERTNIRLLDAIRLAIALDTNLEELQESLSTEDAKLLVMLNELAKAKVVSPVTYLQRIEQHMDGEGMWHSDTTLYTEHPFSVEWLSAKIKNYNDAFLFTATTDAMAPTIAKGETALVNPADTNIRPREIYCISLYGELLFARLSHRQNQIVISYDSAHESEQCISLPSDHMQIKGRVIWVNKEF